MNTSLCSVGLGRESYAGVVAKVRMQVFVKLLSSRTVAVDVSDPCCYTIGDLKVALEARSGVPARLQHLTVGGHSLSENSATLTESCVTG